MADSQEWFLQKLLVELQFWEFEELSNSDA